MRPLARARVALHDEARHEDLLALGHVEADAGARAIGRGLDRPAHLGVGIAFVFVVIEELHARGLELEVRDRRAELEVADLRECLLVVGDVALEREVVERRRRAEVNGDAQGDLGRALDALRGIGAADVGVRHRRLRHGEAGRVDEAARADRLGGRKRDADVGRGSSIARRADDADRTDDSVQIALAVDEILEVLEGAFVRLRRVSGPRVEIDGGAALARALGRAERLVDGVGVVHEEEVAAGELVLEVAVDLATEVVGREGLRGQAREDAPRDRDPRVLADREGEVVDRLVGATALDGGDLGVEEAAERVEVPEPIDELVGLPLRLFLEVERLGELVGVEGAVPVEGREDARAGVEVDVDVAVVVDAALRVADVGAVEAVLLQEIDHLAIGFGERDLVEASALADLVFLLERSELFVLARVDDEDALGDAPRLARGDGDGEDDAFGVVGVGGVDRDVRARIAALHVEVSDALGDLRQKGRGDLGALRRDLGGVEGLADFEDAALNLDARDDAAGQHADDEAHAVAFGEHVDGRAGDASAGERLAHHAAGVGGGERLADFDAGELDRRGPTTAEVRDDEGADGLADQRRGRRLVELGALLVWVLGSSPARTARAPGVCSAAVVASSARTGRGA